MKFTRRLVAIAWSVALALATTHAAGQVSDDVVKIGVIVDAGGVYSANGGLGVLRAVEMAVKDAGGKVLGKPVQIVSADYQNKVDVAAAKAQLEAMAILAKAQVRAVPGNDMPAQRAFVAGLFGRAA